MSVLKVNNIQNASGTDAISIGSDGSLSYPNIGRRNLIINGAMQVAQRGTSETGITGTKYSSVDRFQIGLATLGTWTASQSSDAPNGFNVSAKLTCTTADASPAAGDVLWFQQLIEAQDCQSLAYGTSDAKALTLSFWVKSNVTGTATLTILQPDNSNKLLSPTYTISSADTWEYKTISIPADTSGLINNDNGAGFSIYWMLNSGTNYSSGTNRTSWATYNAADRNASNLGVGGATSDYFAITGVQLEVGSVATPFEHRSYGEELALCQRYFETSFDGGVSTTNTSAANTFVWGGSATATTTSFVGIGSLRYGTPKRATPTITIYDLASPRNTGKCHRLQLGIAGINNESVTVGDNGTSGFTAYSPSGSAATGFAFAYASDAEL